MTNIIWSNKNKAIAIFISIFVISATLGITLTAVYVEDWKLNENSEIAILKDKDFAEKYNFPGNGTTSNPYVIEDLVIYTGKSFAITIQDTTKNFIIRNCTLSAKCCLNIFNVAVYTANIVNNTFWYLFTFNFNYDLSGCISVQFSPGTLIQNNSCLCYKYDTSGRTGLNVFHSDNTKIINNFCFNLSYGISIKNSDNLLIIGNNCTSNSNHGMSIDNTKNSIIMNNKCTNREYGEGIGILVHMASYSLLYNNTCSFHMFGMRIGMFFSIIEMNNVSFNYIEGMACFSLNSTIKNNILKANGIGMLLGGENSSIIENHFLENRLFGLEHGSQNLNNTIYHNNFINNNLLGYNGWTSQAIIREPTSYHYGMSLWYNTTINEGNYWSDIIWNEGVVYSIDGFGNIVDPYPLANPF